jgi:hypothetical protein
LNSFFVQLRGLSDEEIVRRKELLVADLAPEFVAPAQPQQSAKEHMLGQPEFGALQDAAFHFFCEMAKNWFRCATEFYDAAHFDPQLGAGLCRDLARFGLITRHTAKTFRSGGQISFFLPTDKGIEKLRKANVGFMPVRGDAPHGDGSDGSHIWYQNKIERQLSKKGWHAKIEMALKGKRVDVGAILDGGRVMHAYEVVNEGLEKELANLADIDEGWQKVIFCVGNMEIRKALGAIIEMNFGTGLNKCIEFAYLPSFKESNNLALKG